MNNVFWDFSEKVDHKVELYRKYHENSKHSPNTQCFNAPKVNYKAQEQPDIEQGEVVCTMPILRALKPREYTLYEALMDRRSSWQFKKQQLSDEELIEFLVYSFGISDEKNNIKTYPSGGRLYPVEIYIIPTKKLVATSKLFSKDKVYKYNVHSRELLALHSVDLDKADTLTSATDIGVMSFEDAQMLICLVGNTKVMRDKYHSLTYRLIYNELGHIGQNIMLTSSMLGMVSVPLGGFFENRINSYLNLKDDYKSNMYTFVVG